MANVNSIGYEGEKFMTDSTETIIDPDGMNSKNSRIEPVDGKPIPLNQDDDDIPSPDNEPPSEPIDEPAQDKPQKKYEDPPAPEKNKPIEEPNMPLPTMI